MLYPIGIQNFEKIRKDGYAYVDKTALIYRLATTGTYYFLSRPGDGNAVFGFFRSNASYSIIIGHFLLRSLSYMRYYNLSVF